jgi:RND family efflux transporter MFP subunit
MSEIESSPLPVSAEEKSSATDRSPSMRNYRKLFFISLAAVVILAAALGITWRREKQGAALAPAAGPAIPASAEQPAGAVPASPEAKLAPIQLSPERLQSIGVTTGVVQLKSLSNDIRTVGDVEIDERRLSYVQVRFPGWIQKTFVGSTYEYIRKGQPLFTIHSPDLVTTEQEYLIARRNQNALGQSSVPGVAAGSATLIDDATGRLQHWQIPASEIQRLESTGEVRQELEVNSPVSGYVTERNALPNQYVQPETRLYTVADLSSVWVYAAVFQSDIGQVRVGNPAVVTTDAYPGRNFSGRVDFISPQMDVTTRTARVRLIFPNPGLTLKPGMFVNVAIHIPLGRHLSVPASGVLQSGTRAIVFVDRGGGYLEPREVELGPRAGDEYMVLNGLKAGERIITTANFLIDSESQLQAAMGSYVPPPPGAGAAAAVNAPAAQPELRVEFATEPSPPRKGGNLYRVHLVSAAGAPVTGAQVRVRHFMPGMPEMGMAAMSGETVLTEKGSGAYEGTADLQTGGTWQITVTVTKNGAVIATKQLRIAAEGGM